MPNFSGNKSWCSSKKVFTVTYTVCNYIFANCKYTYLAVVDPIEATFGVCDVNKDDKLTMAEVQKDHCKGTIEKWFALANVTEAFLDIDANKDEIITKEEGQDAAIKMMKNFNRFCSDPGTTC